MLHEDPSLRTTLTIPEQFAHQAWMDSGYRALGAPLMERDGLRQRNIFAAFLDPSGAKHRMLCSNARRAAMWEEDDDGPPGPTQHG